MICPECGREHMITGSVLVDDVALHPGHLGASDWPGHAVEMAEKGRERCVAWALGQSPA
jgi:hypothetical protein